MKHYWLVTVFGIILLSLTGCYTQLEVQEMYEEERPIVNPYPEPRPEPNPCLCTNPDPPPLPDPTPIYYPTEQPIKERVYKYRNPESDRPSDPKDRERPRNRGGRNGGERRGR